MMRLSVTQWFPLLLALLTGSILTGVTRAQDPAPPSSQPPAAEQSAPPVEPSSPPSFESGMDVGRDPLADWDVDMLQIAIEGIVVEVNNDYSRSLGIDYSVGDLGSLILDTATEAGIGATFSDIGIGDYVDVTANVRALADTGSADIRTRPVAVALNNTKVKIQTISEIPFQDVKFDNRGNPQFAVTFKKVGVVLEVTPRIIKEDSKRSIELDIENLEVSGVSRFVTSQ
ncbi:hypothetical protein HQ520_10540, partial [bacterium]|nr:hypothetical protein [bacterium]